MLRNAEPVVNPTRPAADHWEALRSYKPRPVGTGRRWRPGRRVSGGTTSPNHATAVRTSPCGHEFPPLDCGAGCTPTRQIAGPGVERSRTVHTVRNALIQSRSATKRTVNRLASRRAGKLASDRTVVVPEATEGHHQIPHCLLKAAREGVRPAGSLGGSGAALVGAGSLGGSHRRQPLVTEL